MNLRSLGAAAVPFLLAAAPAAGRSMPGMSGQDMPGMKMAPPRKAANPASRSKPNRAPVVNGTAAGSRSDVAPAMTGMGGMGSMPGMAPSVTPPGGTGAKPPIADMPGMSMPASDRPAAGGTDLAPGGARPPPPADHYADRSYPPAAMARAREAMMREEGGRTFAQALVNLAEFQSHGGHGGYRWDGEAWIGGDVERLIIKSEGEGSAREGVANAELQALYSRAIGPYFNLQGGVRHDFRPTPAPTYATIGVEGLAPYNFETEAALFLSTKGDLLARAEAWYDERLTQRLVLQPRAELNFAAQDVPENRYGTGLIDAELGLRLRYEIEREFAPYAGVSWQREAGRTAKFARAAGMDTGRLRFVAGIRAWF